LEAQRHWLDKIFETGAGGWHNKPESLLSIAVIFLIFKVAAAFCILFVLYQFAFMPGSGTETSEFDACT
jgi:hypothetical protein